MNRMKLLLIAICISAQAAAQDELALPEVVTTSSLGLKGPVMWVKEHAFATVPKEGELKPPGHPLAYTDTLRVLKSESAYSFNESRQLKQHQAGVVDERKERITATKTVRYNYDANNHLSSILHLDDEELKDSVVIERNRRGRVMNLYKYNKKDKRTGRVQYTYDKTGRLTTIRDKDEENYLLHMVRIAYNEQGEVAERMVYGRDIKPLYGKEYSKEEIDSGRVQYNCFLVDRDRQSKGMEGYVTDAQNRRIEETVSDSNRRVTEYRTIAYNAKGNVIDELVFAERKLHITYRYTYDDHDNWIEKKIYHNDAPAAAITREISYYSSEP